MCYCSYFNVNLMPLLKWYHEMTPYSRNHLTRAYKDILATIKISPTPNILDFPVIRISLRNKKEQGEKYFPNISNWLCLCHLCVREGQWKLEFWMRFVTVIIWLQKHGKTLAIRFTQRKETQRSTIVIRVGLEIWPCIGSGVVSTLPHTWLCANMR